LLQGTAGDTDWLNSLDFKTRLLHKGKLARGFVLLLKINTLVLLLSKVHCSKPLQDRGQRSQSVKPIYPLNHAAEREFEGLFVL
jgi:hypothetical protein